VVHRWQARPRFGPDALEQNFFDGLIEVNFHAKPFRDPRHRSRHRSAATDRVENAVFVFQKREN
jgi:hypothetical protein